MREIIPFLFIGMAACAARTPQTTFPVQYACGNADVVRSGATLVVHEAQGLGAMSGRSDWHDGAGYHFMTAPVSPIDRRAVEYVVPEDPRLDAIERVYDTSNGSARADWRVLEEQTCTAHGGYTDVIGRFMSGESLDELASDLALPDRQAARDLVHDALLSLQRQYYRNR